MIDPRLRLVKIVHTVVWVFFAACVFGILIAASQGRFGLAVILIGFVMVESVVLMANGWRCPLTDVAARYTEDRRDNFDIYLPVWLARYNKEIFGSLFVVGILWTLIGWIRTRTG